MKRIETIHINNFKFFPESKPIAIEGKNILLYGENGSGKSSFYWALYTLLECSGKSEVEIKKYFNKLHAESLVNIHAPADASGIDNSFIKVVLSDGSVFEVSHDETAINASMEAKESLLASDFLNYRLLQRTHAVKHSEEIDLFGVFEDAVFGYVQFSNTNWHDQHGAIIQMRDAGDIYKVVKKGPDKTYRKKNGDLGYPQKGAHNAAHTEFTNLLDRFQRDLNTLIANINSRINPIIQDKFGFDITAHLELITVEGHKLSEANYAKPQFSIRLIIDDFNGTGAVKKPQSFLNEARLSAVALAIRLAVMEQRLNDASIKMLVLDDLMISLDMSNRDKVVKLILGEYAWQQQAGVDTGHQTFILTHDRSLFTFIKKDIENLPAEKKAAWKVIEMYADDIDERDPTSFEKPRIFYNQNDLAVAQEHFRNHDYPAAANYLRKYTEEILCGWLPEYCWKDKESKDKSNNKMPLHNIMENALNTFWPQFGLPLSAYAVYAELKKYLSILMNPLSHADVGVERYKGEIKRIIAVIKQVEDLHVKYKIDTVIAGGEELIIKITAANGDQLMGIYELGNSYYKLTDSTDGSINYSQIQGKMIGWRKIDAAGAQTQGDLGNKPKINMQDNYDEFIRRNAVIGSADWRNDLYRADGIKLF